MCFLSDTPGKIYNSLIIPVKSKITKPAKAGFVILEQHQGVVSQSNSLK